MEYMNQFVDNEFKTDDFVYKSNLTLAKAKEKYPNWYEKRIVKKHHFQVLLALFPTF